MVDLDSNPTKLIEVVEIGKQLLMTRGSLTTFSIANDVAKYFAIIPAMFAATYPALGVLNVMGLESPESAILSSVVFNARSSRNERRSRETTACTRSVAESDTTSRAPMRMPVAISPSEICGRTSSIGTCGARWSRTVAACLASASET